MKIKFLQDTTQVFVTDYDEDSNILTDRPIEFVSGEEVECEVHDITDSFGDKVKGKVDLEFEDGVIAEIDRNLFQIVS